MKKILLVLSTVIISTSAYSQIIWNEDFNSLTNGNLGTDITGATAGQNGWLTIAETTATNSANSNFQIATIDAMHAKSLQMTGSNGIAGTKAVFKNDVATAWTNRTSGNNVIQLEFDFYTGAATNSTNQSRAYISNVTGSGTTAVTKNLVGFTYKHSTRTPGILFYMDPCTVLGGTYCTATPPYTPGNYTLSFNSAAGTPITLNNNEWVKVGIAYNYTNGEVDIKIVRESDGTVILNEYLQGAASSSNISSTMMAVTPRTATTETTNTIGAVATFDNIKHSIVNVVNLLGTKDSKGVKNRNVNLYPNPTADVLNIKTDSKINAVSVVDITGRKIDVKLDGAQVDVRSLPAGTYLINIDTKDGISTEKFIKK